MLKKILSILVLFSSVASVAMQKIEVIFNPENGKITYFKDYNIFYDVDKQKPFVGTKSLINNTGKQEDLLCPIDCANFLMSEKELASNQSSCPYYLNFLLHDFTYTLFQLFASQTKASFFISFEHIVVPIALGVKKT